MARYDFIRRIIERYLIDNPPGDAPTYTHPTSHPAGMIEESSTRVFVTPEQKAALGASSGLTQSQILKRML